MSEMLKATAESMAAKETAGGHHLVIGHTFFGEFH
jgi:hypothetical protein